MQLLTHNMPPSKYWCHLLVKSNLEDQVLVPEYARLELQPSGKYTWYQIQGYFWQIHWWLPIKCIWYHIHQMLLANTSGGHLTNTPYIYIHFCIFIFIFTFLLIFICIFIYGGLPPPPPISVYWTTPLSYTPPPSQLVQKMQKQFVFFLMILMALCIYW